MDEKNWLAQRFEENRSHLQAVAYRILGSLSEADDAVQESWLHVSRAGAAGVDNLRGWLTTIVARICLDMLRARRSRLEDPVGAQAPEPAVGGVAANDPEREAALADSVGLALLVVLETLAPPERLAFVLHDLFALPFEEIAPLVGRTPAATRQLASRARRRVQGPVAASATRSAATTMVEAFLAASRKGDFDALLALLDPDVVLRADADPLAGRPAKEIRGARAVVGQALGYPERQRFSRVALINGEPGLIVAPRGRLLLVLRFTVKDDKITGIDVVVDRERLRQLDLAVAPA
jgi:RNA polymerase sigma factor (sigma-70 family)